jgi:hypothetical protein
MVQLFTLSKAFRRVGEGLKDVIIPFLSKPLCLVPEKLEAVELFTALPATHHFQSLEMCLKWLVVHARSLDVVENGLAP